MTLGVIRFVVGFQINTRRYFEIVRPGFLENIGSNIPEDVEELIEDRASAEPETSFPFENFGMEVSPDENVIVYSITHDYYDDDKQDFVIGIRFGRWKRLGSITSVPEKHGTPIETTASASLFPEFDFSKIEPARERLFTLFSQIRQFGITPEDIKIYALPDDCDCCS